MITMILVYLNVILQTTTLFLHLYLFWKKQLLKKTFRDYSFIAISKFKSEFNILLSKLNANNGSLNLDDNMLFFCLEMFKIYNCCCPIRIKQVSENPMNKPWINKRVLCAPE